MHQPQAKQISYECGIIGRLVQLMDRQNDKFLAILTDSLHLLVKQNKDAKVN
jgi:hypothetical protein